MPGTIWSDIIPPPPVGLSATPLDNGLRVTWQEPASPGSPIDHYVVTVGDTVRTLAASSCDSGGFCAAERDLGVHPERHLGRATR